MSDELYSFEEACARSGKTEGELRDLIELGILDEVYRNGSVWLRAAEVDALGAAPASSELTQADDESEPAMAGFLDFDQEPEPEDISAPETDGTVFDAAAVPLQAPSPQPSTYSSREMGRFSLWRRFWEGLQDDKIAAVFAFGIGLLVILSACALVLSLLLRQR